MDFKISRNPELWNILIKFVNCVHKQSENWYEFQVISSFLLLSTQFLIKAYGFHAVFVDDQPAAIQYDSKP